MAASAEKVEAFADNRVIGGIHDCAQQSEMVLMEAQHFPCIVCRHTQTKTHGSFV
jgi:hypothetical protein